MKRLLLCIILLCACLAPSKASAVLFPPWYVVFTFTADPLDPLGGTSTGWHFLYAFDGAWQRPIEDDGEVDFWWQAQHWTAANTLSSTYTGFGAANIGYDWFICGGPEGNAFGGNALDLDFDIQIKGGVYDPALGVIYTGYMYYVNPTVSQFGHPTDNGSYYLATGTWYVTNDRPPAASPPGIPEPSSFALLAIGLGVMVANRRSCKGVFL